MSRHFRDAWDATSPGDEPVAPDDVQDRVSALLREQASAQPVAMPGDVEASIRAALASESPSARLEQGRSRPEGETSTGLRAGDAADLDAGTGIPLPRRGAPPTQPSRHAAGVSAVPLPAQPQREVATTGARPSVAQTRATVETRDDWPRQATSSAPSRTTAAREGSTTASDAAHHGATGAGVTSLDAHRRRRGFGKATLALGAAAAVAIGAVTAVKMSEPDDAPVAAPSSVSASDYASRVRVTQTATKYTSNRLATQAAALPMSKAATVEPSRATNPGLGHLATGKGVQDCLNGVAKGLVSHPDKVYADFATFDGTPAVIIVVEQGKTRTAWVVSQTCSTKTDLEAGPTPLDT